jgi:hypothetical protein
VKEVFCMLKLVNAYSINFLYAQSSRGEKIIKLTVG